MKTVFEGEYSGPALRVELVVSPRVTEVMLRLTPNAARALSQFIHSGGKWPQVTESHDGALLNAINCNLRPALREAGIDL